MTLTRRLAFIALAAALVSAGCLGGAYTLANANDSGSEELVTREIPWDGSQALIADLPSATRYIQAPGPGRIVARGPHRSVSTLSVSDGRVHDSLLHTGEMIELTVTAPDVTMFTINGRSRLEITSYDHDRLSLDAQGAAEITVSGRARDVDVSMQGGGAINLAGLASENLHADIGGDGVLIAAPQARAELAVHNRATAILLTHPSELTSNLESKGRVIDAAPAP